MNRYQALIIYINLTAGIEALINFAPYSIDLRFVRFQSTLLEQGHHEKFLADIDYDFLLNLAIGNQCVVYDFTSRWGDKRPSRAIWMGLPLIDYTLNRCWFGKEIECERRMDKHFKTVYSSLSKRTKNKFRYFKKFLLTDRLYYSYKCEPTNNDGDTDFYRGILDQWQNS